MHSNKGFYTRKRLKKLEPPNPFRGDSPTFDPQKKTPNLAPVRQSEQKNAPFTEQT